MNQAQRDHKAEWSRYYYQTHKDNFRRRDVEWRAKNPEAVKAIHARYRELHRDEIKKARKCHREKLKLNMPIALKIEQNLRKRTRRVLKGNRKSGRILELLGCSIDEFKLHLARRFQLGMTFFNYGMVWHLDHVIPCGNFDLTDPDEQRRCFHYSNLAPMFAGQNMRKQP